MVKIVRALFLILLLLLALTACGEDRPGHAEISKTWDQYYSVSSWKTGPLYGGTAVLVNDSASYWLKDGQVYACNGIALGCSPKTLKSPPSVGENEIQMAIKGQAPTMPPVFPMSYETFLKSMLAQLEPYGFKKSIWSQYEAQGVEFNIEEKGGQLTKVGMSCLVEEENLLVPFKTMVAIYRSLDPALTDEAALELLKQPFINSVQNIGETYETTEHGATVALSASEIDGKKYVELTARPSKSNS